jgi:hypothetical protein
MAVKATVFFLAALLFFASGAWARPTTEDEARNVAVKLAQPGIKAHGVTDRP